MKRLILFFVFVFLVSAGFVYAQPQIPIQVYGAVDKSIPNGYSVTFKIGNTVVGSGTVKDNKYGYEPVVFVAVDDTATTEKEGYKTGDSVDVYVNNVKVESGLSLTTGANQLTLHISDQEYNSIIPPAQYGASGSGSSGSSSGSGSSGSSSSGTAGSGGAASGGTSCSSEWICGGWSGCVNSVQTRTCSDAGTCRANNRTEEKYCVQDNAGYLGEKPTRTLDENIARKEAAEKRPLKSYIKIGFLVLVGVGGLVLFVVIIMSKIKSGDNMPKNEERGLPEKKE